MRRLAPAILVALLACNPPAEQAPLLKPAGEPRSILPADTEEAHVKFVFDGDTVELDDGRKVRYLGIDTPEFEEAFSRKAKEFNAGLVQGRDVRLEFDAEKKDKHGRLLAFVYVKRGEETVMVSAELVRQGFAYVYTPGVNARHKESLLKCQKEAREAKRGLWKREPPKGEKEYQGSPGGYAFHRPGCEKVKETNPDKLIRWKARNEAFDAGRSPCRDCKP